MIVEGIRVAGKRIRKFFPTRRVPVTSKPTINQRPIALACSICGGLTSMNTPKYPRKLLPLDRLMANMFGIVGFGVVSVFGQETGSPMEPRDSEEEQGYIYTLAPYEVTSGSNVGYGALDASSSSRLNLLYLDVPQSISVLTSELFNDTNITSSRDMYKWANNVETLANNADSMLIIRGLDTTHTYRDGFRLSARVTRDAALYDRIEIVKGPASAAIGRGQAGGMLNLISKKPIVGNRTKTKITFGTEKYRRFELDVNHRISDSVVVRIPAFFEEGDGPLGGPLWRTEKYGVGPSVRWQIGPDTEIVATFHGFHTTGPGQSGEADFMDGRDGTIFRLRQSVGQMVGSAWNPYDFPKIPLDSGWGYPGIGRFDDVAEFSATLTHRFSESITYRQNFFLDSFKQEIRQNNKIANTLEHPTDPNNFLVPLLYRHRFYDGEQGRVQGDLIFEKEVNRTSHVVLVGYEAAKTKAGFRNGQKTTTESGIPLTDELYNPQHIPPPDFDFETTAPITTKSLTKFRGIGYYGHYIGSFWEDKIKVIAGVRQDSTKTKTINLITQSDPGWKDVTLTSPRYSISYKPVPQVSVYYLRSHQEEPPKTAFRFSNFTPSSGAVVPPDDDPRRQEMVSGQLKAKLDEVGIKGSFFENRLMFSMAYYKLVRDGKLDTIPINEPQPSAEFPQALLVYRERQVTRGEEYEGWEVDLTGVIGDRVTFLAAYSDPKGKVLYQNELVPRRSLIETFRFLGKYRWDLDDQSGIEATLGFRYLFGGWRLRRNSDVLFEKDQYGIDAGVSYHWNDGRSRVRLYGNNLTNDPQLTGTNTSAELRRYYISWEQTW